MSAPSRILVTGASGFVGRALVPALVARFPACEILALGGDQPAEFNLPGVRVAPFSLLEPSPGDVGLFDPAPDVVIHLAARSSVAASATAAYDTVTTNLGGTMRLADLIRRHAPGAKVIFASTGEVYGATFTHGPAKETDPAQPRNPYARSKLACEYALSDMLGDAHPVVVLRLFNHTGPGQDERFVAPSFAAQIARAERGEGPAVIKVGNLAAERDFLDLADVIEAYLRVVGASLPHGAHVYNVCSGQAVSIQSILDTLVAQARAPLTVEADPDRMRPSDIPRAVGDGGRFQSAFDWRPSTPLAQTLAGVLAYWRGM